MNEILPRLYLGALEDSQWNGLLHAYDIKNILSIHNFAEPGDIDGMTYKCIKIEDSENVEIKEHFLECIEFIHKARLNSQNVLVHCFSGKSRSATICIAYIMFVTKLSFIDALNCVRARRPIVFPNFGFQRQLKHFEENYLKQMNSIDYHLKHEDLSFCEKSLKLHKSRKELLKAKLNESKSYLLKNRLNNNN
jgi:hypothetical protein